MALPRTILFIILGVGFALGPLHNVSIFRAGDDLVPLLVLIEMGIVLPLMTAAAALTWFNGPLALTQATQSVAVLGAVAAPLAFRYFALDTGINYPPQMSGLALVAVAMFGGFRWRRIWLVSGIYLVCAVSMEFRVTRDNAASLMQAYSDLYMAMIAFAGAALHEFLTRYAYWELNRVKDARTALGESEARFYAFMDNSPVIAWIKDGQFRYVYRNRGHRDRYGEPGADWTGHTDDEYFPAEASRVYRETDDKVMRSGEPVSFETANRSRTGEVQRWWVQKFPVPDETGQRLVAGIGIDVSERQKLEARLRESDERFQIFLDNSPTVAWMKDEAGHYIFASRAFRAFLGVTDDSWIGKTDADYFPMEFAERSYELDLDTLTEGKSTQVEGMAKTAAGETRHWLLTRFPLTDSTGRRFVGGVATDLTDRKRAEELVRLQALTDDLTGVYNRRGFSAVAEQELKLAKRNHARCALLYADLDGLKRINQDHGHAGGDAAITAVSEALRVAVRDNDILGRVGGDEFVVFVTDCDDIPALQRAIIDRVACYQITEGLPFALSVSLGVSEFDPADGKSLEQHMLIADEEMFKKKRTRDTQQNLAL